VQYLRKASDPAENDEANSGLPRYEHCGA
jgi:hypothetical protein